MGQILNRRRVMGGKSLPYGAVRIEYLESSGTQWIDTGMVLSIKNDYTISMSFGMVDLRPSHSCFGAQNSDNRTITHFNGQLYAGNGARRITFPITSNSTITAQWTNENGAHYLEGFINEESYGKVQIIGNFSNTTYGFLLLHGGNGVIPISCEVKQCSIKKGNNVILDLIPVRVGTTGYMYDKVSGQLFGNAGTGDFILGNDI